MFDPPYVRCNVINIRFVNPTIFFARLRMQVKTITYKLPRVSRSTSYVLSSKEY